MGHFNVQGYLEVDLFEQVANGMNHQGSEIFGQCVS